MKTTNSHKAIRTRKLALAVCLTVIAALAAECVIERSQVESQSELLRIIASQPNAIATHAYGARLATNNP